MVQFLIFVHSLFRWLVLIGLSYAIVTAYRGKQSGSAFTKKDNKVRHWTATIAHIQLIIGFSLFLKSPAVKFFFSDPRSAIGYPEPVFFSLVHFLMMLSAIVVITIGSALSKRRSSDFEKFRTMFVWYTAAIVIIFIAIPWPFSPLAQRPYFRTL